MVNSLFLKQPFHIKKGGSIRTENSHKYSLESIE
ncbi:MAG: hypothetical protein GQ525_01080 [Draconibacterium sp.]|nr:hypothetical protein [Draconibacterium sp.]